jgi:hypothetical protein
MLCGVTRGRPRLDVGIFELGRPLPGCNDPRSRQTPFAQYFPAGWTVDCASGEEEIMP